jgi:hypothetical protein
VNTFLLYPLKFFVSSDDAMLQSNSKNKQIASSVYPLASSSLAPLATSSPPRSNPSLNLEALAGRRPRRLARSPMPSWLMLVEPPNLMRKAGNWRLLINGSSSFIVGAGAG